MPPRETPMAPWPTDPLSQRAPTNPKFEGTRFVWKGCQKPNVRVNPIWMPNWPAWGVACLPPKAWTLNGEYGCCPAWTKQWKWKKGPWALKFEWGPEPWWMKNAGKWDRGTKGKTGNGIGLGKPLAWMWLKSR